jgi:phage shock protein A
MFNSRQNKLDKIMQSSSNLSETPIGFGFGFFGKKKISHQSLMRQKTEEISLKARKVADGLDAQINVTKLALVHIVGEYCLGMTELKSMIAGMDAVEKLADQAILSGDKQYAMLKIAEQKMSEGQVQQFIDSINMLSPKILELRTRLGQLRNQKNNSLIQAGALESRARFVETMTHVDGLVGSSSDSLKGMDETVREFEAYTSAYQEVFSVNPDEHFEAPSQRTEVDEEYERRLAFLKGMD